MNKIKIVIISLNYKKVS